MIGTVIAQDPKTMLPFFIDHLSCSILPDIFLVKRADTVAGQIHFLYILRSGQQQLIPITGNTAADIGQTFVPGIQFILVIDEPDAIIPLEPIHTGNPDKTPLILAYIVYIIG
jgi:hypothetical protein